MKWPPWDGLGSWGQERPPSRWVQGERSLPRVVDRRYDLLALERVQRPDRATAWGMQRGRAAAPLPRWFCTTKHILRVRTNASQRRRIAETLDIVTHEHQQCVHALTDISEELQSEWRLPHLPK